MKAKSDYVLSPLGPDAIAAMMSAASAAGSVALLCDGYGGKIADVAATDTAFPRRAGTQFCIQYYSSWTRPADTPAHLASVAKVYAAMRPYMPGAAYVNYCDLDLPDYPNAYWGDNLPRLMAVKQQYDPQNLFHHAQSVPLPSQPVA
jgi:FAD/FMN-containing dehydrogenase